MATNQATFNAIVEQVRNNQISGTLDLSNQGITDSDAQAIAEALKVNTSVTSLELSGNNISDAGATDLARILKLNNTLVFLNLAYNRIGELGSTALSEALKINNSIKLFYLSFNNVSDLGASNFAKSLQVNNALLELGLSGNAIGIFGATDLANALQINNSLTSLYLRNNLIGDSGAEAMSHALRINTALTLLDLYNNGISDTGAEFFISTFSINYSLTFFHIGDSRNFITSTNINTINFLIQRNSQYIQFGPIFNNNEIPFVGTGANYLTVNQGEMITLTPNNLQAVQFNNNGVNIMPSIIFNIIETEHCVFCNATTQRGLTQFTPVDILAGQVQFIHDGSAFAPTYSITASNGTLTTPAHQGAVIFTQSINPPLLSKNNLRLQRNQTTMITTENLLATLDGITPLPGLIFNVMNVTAGQFEQVGTTQALTTFSQGLVMSGRIEFACDNSGLQPYCQIQVSDGNRTTSFVPANITFVHFSTLPSSMTTQTQNPSTFLTGQTTRVPTAFTSLPPTVSSSMSGVTFNTALVPSANPTDSYSKISAISGVFGAVAAIGTLTLSWFIYRKRREREIERNAVRPVNDPQLPTLQPITQRSREPSPEPIRSVPVARQAEPPDDYSCPICLGTMTEDPVVDNHGDSYCRKCIERVFSTGSRISPLNRQPITSLVPNRGLNGAIQHWLEENDPQRLRFPRTESEI